MRPTIAVMVLSLFLLPARPWAAPPAPTTSRPQQAQAQTEPERREASDAERKEYAEREQQATELEKFKGGSHQLVAVLLVVLLVVVILYLLKVI